MPRMAICARACTGEEWHKPAAAEGDGGQDSV